MSIYFWDRDRVRAGEGQRERETQSETGSRLWAVSTEPDTRLELTHREIMTWAKVGRPAGWATQVHPPPPNFSFWKVVLRGYRVDLQQYFKKISDFLLL